MRLEARLGWVLGNGTSERLVSSRLVSLRGGAADEARRGEAQRSETRFIYLRVRRR